MAAKSVKKDVMAKCGVSGKVRLSDGFISSLNYDVSLLVQPTF